MKSALYIVQTILNFKELQNVESNTNIEHVHFVVQKNAISTISILHTNIK